jgi:tripartite-type tricarboxylate transporter receptor subunit TctC
MKKTFVVESVARRGAWLLMGLGLIAAAAFSNARAAGFPEKPITLVVPYPAGGATDIVGRILAKGIGARIGQTVVVDNKAGGGTTIGAAYVAKAPADGYTLLISSGTTFTVNPAIYPKLPYDTVQNFEAIGIAGSTPLVLLANPKTPVNSLKELVAAAKAEPDKFTYASFGSGTTSHFAGEMLKDAAGIKLLHVPYKGSAPAMTDLIGGQVALSIDTAIAALPQLKGGKVKALAVTSAKRSKLLPDVPTVAESGYPGYEMAPWVAIVGPRGMPADVKAKLQRALADTVADKATAEELAASGLEVAFSPPAAFDAIVAKELPLMRAVAQRANIKVD